MATRPACTRRCGKKQAAAARCTWRNATEAYQRSDRRQLLSHRVALTGSIAHPLRVAEPRRGTPRGGAQRAHGPHARRRPETVGQPGALASLPLAKARSTPARAMVRSTPSPRRPPSCRSRHGRCSIDRGGIGAPGPSSCEHRRLGSICDGQLALAPCPANAAARHLRRHFIDGTRSSSMFARLRTDHPCSSTAASRTSTPVDGNGRTPRFTTPRLGNALLPSTSSSSAAPSAPSSH